VSHSPSAPALAVAAVTKAVDMHASSKHAHCISYLDRLAQALNMGTSSLDATRGADDVDDDEAHFPALRAYATAFLAYVAHVVALRLTHYALPPGIARKLDAQDVARIVYCKAFVLDKLCSIVTPPRGYFVLGCIQQGCAAARNVLRATFASEVDGITDMESALDVLFLFSSESVRVVDRGDAS